MEATMKAPVGGRPATETHTGIKAALPAPAEESGKSKVSKSELRRQKNQEHVCCLFAMILIMVAILAGYMACRIPLSAAEFTAEDVWKEMAACIVFFLSLSGGTWTIRNALL